MWEIEVAPSRPTLTRETGKVRAPLSWAPILPSPRKLGEADGDNMTVAPTLPRQGAPLSSSASLLDSAGAQEGPPLCMIEYRARNYIT